MEKYQGGGDEGMRKVSSIIVSLMLLAVSSLCVLITGCSESGTKMLFENETETTDVYYSNVALSATEYEIFIENVKIKTNTYGMTICNDILQYAKKSIDKETFVRDLEDMNDKLGIQYEDIKHKRPAQGYEKERENVMSILNNIQAQVNYVSECIEDETEFDADAICNTIRNQITDLYTD